MADKAQVEGEEVEAYPAKEQGIEPEKTSEEKKEDMEEGEKDEDVYSEEGREKLEEDDEIDDWEAGYMEGAEHKGEQAMCAHCRKVLRHWWESLMPIALRPEKLDDTVLSRYAHLPPSMVEAVQRTVILIQRPLKAAYPENP